jgi:hypothetical protein
MSAKMSAVPDPDNDNGEGQDDNYDPLDPASHKVSQPDYDTDDLSVISVRKPGPREFFRSHPDPAYRRDVELFEHKGKESELYLVHRCVAQLFEEELISVRLVTSINKVGSVFLCPIRIWDDDNVRLYRLFTSAMKIVARSETEWIRRRYSQDEGGYAGKAAVGDLGDPAWPSASFSELFRLAFDGRVIDNIDHAVLKELRGEI